MSSGVQSGDLVFGALHRGRDFAHSYGPVVRVT
jgi:hypothetical protein